MQTISSHRQRALALALIALVVAFIVWNTPQLSVLLFPFRLFVTFVHEAGHGLAAILTGGRFLAFTINAGGSGFATTAGGAREVILPAGYLGAALFGAVLFYLTNTVPYPRQISVALGGLVILIAALFGGIISLASLVGVLMGGALIATGLRGGRDLNLLVLNLLAILTALNAVLDVVYLVSNSTATAGPARNDALAFQTEITPLIPAALCALVWSGLALAMLGIAVYYGVVHPWRARQPDKW